MSYQKLINKYEYKFIADYHNKIFVLKIKNHKEFLKEMMCRECKTLIDDEQPYFCPKGGWFFHKKCLAEGNHNLRFQTTTNYVHLDFPVVIEELKSGN